MKSLVVIPEELNKKKREAKKNIGADEKLDEGLDQASTIDIKSEQEPNAHSKNDRDLPVETSELISRLSAVDRATYCSSNAALNCIEV